MQVENEPQIVASPTMPVAFDDEASVAVYRISGNAVDELLGGSGQVTIGAFGIVQAYSGGFAMLSLSKCCLDVY